MSISFVQAKESIQNQTLNLSQLIDLVRNTTGAVEGANPGTQYFLYSGKLQNGVDSFRVVDELVEMSQGVWIEQTAIRCAKAHPKH